MDILNSSGIDPLIQLRSDAYKKVKAGHDDIEVLVHQDGIFYMKLYLDSDKKMPHFNQLEKNSMQLEKGEQKLKCIKIKMARRKDTSVDKITFENGSKCGYLELSFDNDVVLFHKIEFEKRRKKIQKYTKTDVILLNKKFTSEIQYKIPQHAKEKKMILNIRSLLGNEKLQPKFIRDTAIFEYPKYRELASHVQPMEFELVLKIGSDTIKNTLVLNPNQDNQGSLNCLPPNKKVIEARLKNKISQNKSNDSLLITSNKKKHFRVNDDQESECPSPSKCFKSNYNVVQITNPPSTSGFQNEVNETNQNMVLDTYVGSMNDLSSINNESSNSFQAEKPDSIEDVNLDWSPEERETILGLAIPIGWF